jgi:hypothetical protein
LAIVVSASAVNSFSAKATGHRVPSSRFALSVNRTCRYLALNFWALWKKQTTLPGVSGVGRHAVPGFGQERWSVGFDDGVEALCHGAIGRRHFGNGGEFVSD